MRCQTKPIRLQTILGEIELSSLYGQESCNGPWISVVRDMLGLESHQAVSVVLQERLCFTAVATGSYDMAAQVAGKWGGWMPEDSTIHSHVQRAGMRARELSDSRVERALNPQTRKQVVQEAAASVPQGKFSLIIMIDGWMARHKGSQWGLKPSQVSAERVEWHEIKTGIVFRVEDRSESASGRRMLVDKYCVAWEGDPQELGRKLHAQALRRGLAQADQVFVVADGGVWIWNIFEDRFAQATGVLDFYHAAEHLWAVAHELYGKGPEAADWAKPLLHQLRNGGEFGVLRTLTDLIELCHNSTDSAKQCVQQTLNYFNNHRDHIHYSEIEKQGCPCGSGAMESTCAQLQTRFKRPGQFWSEPGILNLLELELYRRNKDWHDLWPNPK